MTTNHAACVSDWSPVDGCFEGDRALLLEICRGRNSSVEESSKRIVALLDMGVPCRRYGERRCVSKDHSTVERTPSSVYRSVNGTARPLRTGQRANPVRYCCNRVCRRRAGRQAGDARQQQYMDITNAICRSTYSSGDRNSLLLMPAP